MSLIAGAALSEEQAPAPDFAVAASFQEIVARLMARDCVSLRFDDAAFDRHKRALWAEYENRGYPSAQIDTLFAPTDPVRYEPLFVSLMNKHDLKEASPDADFCAAGVAEAEEHTALGQLLEVVGQ